MYNDNNILRVYFDCEFTGLYKNTELISIGLISEGNDIFYAERNDLNYKLSSKPNILLNKNDVLIDDFVKENVVDRLLFNDFTTHQIVADKESFMKLEVYKNTFTQISEKLNDWLNKINKNNSTIQFFCDCGYFDMVLLIDLITNHRSSLDLSTNISYIPVDLCTLLQYNDYDPDCNRVSFAYRTDLKYATSYHELLDNVFNYILNNQNIIVDAKKLDNLKHNALYDAITVRQCFRNLLQGSVI